MLPAYSSRDCRWLLRLCLFLVIWKQLSTDYSALPGLLQGGSFYYAPGNALVMTFGRAVLSQSIIVPWQLSGAFFLALSGWSLRRRWALVGLSLVTILEAVAFRFRGSLYDLDFPLALLGLSLLYPWHGVRKDGEEASASQICQTLAIYTAGAYLLAGVSKIWNDPLWFLHARLDLMPAAVQIWNGATPPGWMEKTIGLLVASTSFWQIETSLALLLLVAELLWWTALIKPWGRVFPILVFLGHGVIFLCSGLQFLSMAVAGLATLAPWSWVKRERSNLSFARKGATASALALLVPITVGPLSPMLPYNWFGWTYQGVEGSHTHFRLGYRNAQGQLEALPYNHGGFLDFRTATLPQRLKDRPDALARLVSALRPHQSNRWLLGSFSHPDHIVSQSKALTPKELERIELLEIQYEYSEGKLRISAKEAAP